MRPEAHAAMVEGFAAWANPSSPHGEGRKAKVALENARERIKKALGWAGEVIFTSGASEALAIGLGRAKIMRRIVSAAEHDAVFRAADGYEVLPIVDGAVDSSALDGMLSSGEPSMVAVQAINSETGTVLLGADENVADRVRDHGSLLLSDCSQSAAKMPLPDADMIVLSAHKLGGPVGIGALLVRDYNMLEPTGGHERGYRSGTENLPGAMGFAAALEAGGMESWRTTKQERWDFRAALSDVGEVLEPGSQCSYIIAAVAPRISASAMLIRLDAAGFGVSAGSACSSGTLKRSRVLEAFGVAEDIARRTIRVSIGWSTTPKELERFAAAWVELNS